MTDFTAEDLFDVVDRIVADLLGRNGIDGPPVDAVALVQDAFGIPVTESDAEEEESGRFGPRARRGRRREIVLRPDQSNESRHAVCARACAKELLPTILAKLGVVPGTENKGAQTSLIGLVAPRLLLPTRWFERDARKAGYDLTELKTRYDTVGYELLAARMLDLDEPCVIAVVDNGAVVSRRGNREAATKKLTPAEETCIGLVETARESCVARKGGWTVRGWPVPTGPFNRIILRSVPDDL
ncbi:hypothetical protein [Fimbriiglobus ruber]|uniref:Uncharacterized protein n=1 Tax=Fimbriiglobus ruber TaxID=1908690 RepID=A0A225DMB8_9BACT|nr:hypothetical protein [Fimbriiglobus ruber]OWK39698.1 hypothetical protein FRUB_05588 [Fimbriiglobus ruber]